MPWVCLTFRADLLNALGGQKGAPRMLYAAVFLAQSCAPQQRQNWPQQRRQQRAPKPQLPQPPRRIPASLKPLLAALKQLLGACSCGATTLMHSQNLARLAAQLVLLLLQSCEHNGVRSKIRREKTPNTGEGTMRLCAGRAAKCPYGILLDHHCPLPASLTRTQAAVSAEAAVEAPKTPPRNRYIATLGSTLRRLKQIRESTQHIAPTGRICWARAEPADLGLSPVMEEGACGHGLAAPCAQHAEVLTHAPSPREEQGQRGMRSAQRRAPVAAARSRPPPQPPEELIREFVPHCHVIAFVWSVVRHVVPVVISSAWFACADCAAGDSRRA